MFSFIALCFLFSLFCFLFFFVFIFFRSFVRTFTYTYMHTKLPLSLYATGFDGQRPSFHGAGPLPRRETEQSVLGVGARKVANTICLWPENTV